MGGNCLLSNLAMSLLKYLTELDAVLIDGFSNAGLITCVLDVWLDSLFCSLCAENSELFFIQVIFLSS